MAKVGERKTAGGGQTVVPPDECVTIVPSLHTVDKLLRFLERNVHVPIHRLKLSYVPPGQRSAKTHFCAPSVGYAFGWHHHLPL